MKNRRLIPLFVSASLFGALGFGAVSPVSAQPATAPATTGRKAKGAKRGANKGLSKRMVEKVEEKMGKPLTDDQKTRLGAAYKVRTAAAKAAQDKFNQEAATITGLSLEEMSGLNKRGKMAKGERAKGERAKGAMAPAAAPATR